MRFVKAQNLDKHDRSRFNELRHGDGDAVVETEFNDFIESIRCIARLRTLPESRIGERKNRRRTK